MNFVSYQQAKRKRNALDKFSSSIFSISQHFLNVKGIISHCARQALNLLGGFGEIFNVVRVPPASVSCKISARIESTKPSKTESRWCHDRETKAQTHLHSASKSNLTVSKSHHLTPFFFH